MKKTIAALLLSLMPLMAMESKSSDDLEAIEKRFLSYKENHEEIKKKLDKEYPHMAKKVFEDEEKEYKKYFFLSEKDLEEKEGKYSLKYLEILTKNRTKFTRAPNGVIAIDINPREGETIEIGGKSFQSPKNFSGIKIKIGKFVASKEQTDRKFKSLIKFFDEVVCVCTHSPAEDKETD